jgi:hypothetical protein
MGKELVCALSIFFWGMNLPVWAVLTYRIVQLYRELKRYERTLH